MKLLVLLLLAQLLLVKGQQGGPIIVITPPTIKWPPFIMHTSSNLAHLVLTGPPGDPGAPGPPGPPGTCTGCGVCSTSPCTFFWSLKMAAIMHDVELILLSTDWWKGD